jgi:tripartite-type tricarboxylate transporter receptor subunit TctC
MTFGSFATLTIRVVLCTLSCIAVLGFARAQAETYPTKPVRMIVPTAPGGPVDVLARLTSDSLAAALGQPVVIENRPGAGTVLGTRAAAAAPPDGYTLLFGASSSLAVTPALHKDAGYDPVKSFAPVASVAEGALVLAVTPSLAVQSVADLVAYAKANPGKLNYGSGQGTTPHIGWGLFKLRTATDILYVPYQGATPAITDLIAGRMHMVFDAPGALLGHAEQGKLRALAVTSEKRIAAAPELPTMIESGYPGFVITFWAGVVAPAGTPEPIVARLNAAINESLRSPAMRHRLAEFQVEPLSGSPQNFGAFIAAEAKKWAAVVQAAGIKAE